MRLIPVVLTAAALLGAAGSAASQTLGLRLLLVGDSTMAPRSGYGNALCQRLDQLACLNLARGGRSTRSYRAEGLWDSVLTLLREGGQRDLVLIQFGHNDQPGKPGRSTDLASEFGPNLSRYVHEARAAGAEVVLLTPLTRRTFVGGTLYNDLRPWAEATLRVAAALQVPVIDLNAISAAAVQELGQAGADRLAIEAPGAAASADTGTSAASDTRRGLFDRTHVGAQGATLFADQVLQALLTLRPELRPALTASP